MFDGVFPKAGFIYIAGDRIAALFIFCCGIFFFLRSTRKFWVFLQFTLHFEFFIFFVFFFIFLIVRCLNPVLKWNCFIVVFFFSSFFLLAKSLFIFSPRNSRCNNTNKKYVAIVEQRLQVTHISEQQKKQKQKKKWTQIKLKMKKDTPECSCKEPLLQHPLT